jgi:hypothetical protein
MTPPRLARIIFAPNQRFRRMGEAGGAYIPSKSFSANSPSTIRMQLSCRMSGYTIGGQRGHLCHGREMRRGLLSLEVTIVTLQHRFLSSCQALPLAPDFRPIA